MYNVLNDLYPQLSKILIEQSQIVEYMLIPLTILVRWINSLGTQSIELVSFLYFEIRGHIQCNPALRN